MLLEQIVKDLEIATREQNPLVLITQRYILSEIRYAEIDKQRKLTDEEIVSVLQKEVKKRNEAIVMMQKAGRTELVEEENIKLEVIKKYLPEDITDRELEKIITEVIATQKNPQIGAVIGAVMQKVKGRADGKKVAEIVKRKLQTVTNK